MKPRYFTMRMLLAAMLSLAAVVVAQHVPRAHAAGITISPAFQEVTVTGSVGAESASFFLSNNNDTSQNYRLQAIDIDTDNQSGGVLLSGLDSNFQIKYGLARWLTFVQPQVTIGPNETKEIFFTVQNSDDLSPGGHYGAIVAQPVFDAQPESDNRVSVSPQTAALVFVKKIGGERYGMNLLSLSTSGSLTSPKSAKLLFENSGDVHIVPRGVVTVLDPFGKEVLRGAINTDSGLLLPSKQRNFVVDLRQSIGGIRWPGRYKITALYRYDGQETVENYQQDIWIISIVPLLLIVVITTSTAILAWRYGYAAGRTLRVLKHKIVKLKNTVHTKRR